MSRILYKYIDRGGAKWMLGMEKGRKYPNLQFTNPTMMNDPFDCNPNLMDYSNIPESMLHGWIPKAWMQEKEENDALNKRNNAWICCLSKVYDELLMWAHYSGNHSGLCVGINLDKVLKSAPPIFDSHYLAPLVMEVQYQNISKRPDYKTVSWSYQLETKDKKWEYEQEVRLVCPNAAHIYADFPQSAKSNDVKELREYMPLKGECIEEIYFGKDVDKKEKDKIVDFARTQLNPNVKLYQMKVDENAFRLKAEEINY